MKYTGTSLIAEPKKTKVLDSSIVNKEIKELIGNGINEKEYFCIITLDGASHIIRKEVAHIGTLNQSLVHPRDVFRPALIDNAAAVIIAHNHPSGQLSASRADIQLTNRLKEGAKILGIELLDHVIITELGYFSFTEDGLI